MFQVINYKAQDLKPGTIVYYNMNHSIVKAIFLRKEFGRATVYSITPPSKDVTTWECNELFTSLEDCVNASIEATKQAYIKLLDTMAEPKEPVKQKDQDIYTTTDPMDLMTALLDAGITYAYAKITVKAAGGSPVMVKASLTPDNNPRFRYRNNDDIKTHDPGWSVCYVSRGYYDKPIWCVSERDAEQLFKEQFNKACKESEYELEAEVYG